LVKFFLDLDTDGERERCLDGIRNVLRGDADRDRFLVKERSLEDDRDRALFLEIGIVFFFTIAGGETDRKDDCFSRPETGREMGVDFLTIG